MTKMKQIKRTGTKTKRRKTEPPAKIDPLIPEKVHQLFDLPGQFEPPPRPADVKGYVTFWDPGLSIADLRRKYHHYFAPTDMSDGLRFLKETDVWRWKQIRLDSVETDATFEEQCKQMPFGEPATAREIVTFLILRFLTTGERIEMNRLRCCDVVPSGRRVIVGPFSSLGLSIGTVNDRWKSSSVGLSSVVTPKRKK